MIMDTLKLLKKGESISQELVKAILNGSVTSNTEMTQNEIAESLGVSRMPVREALIILEYQGLIEKLPNQHIKVTDISLSFFEEIYQSFLYFTKSALKDIQSFDFSDEEEFFNTLINKTKNNYYKKNLSSLTTVYFEYASHYKDRESVKMKELLKKALSDKSDKDLLSQYFSQLCKDAWNKRNGK